MKMQPGFIIFRRGSCACMPMQFDAEAEAPACSGLGLHANLNYLSINCRIPYQLITQSVKELLYHVVLKS